MEHAYLRAIISSPADALLPVYPVDKALQRVEADRSQIPQHVDRQNHIRALLPQHHATDRALLTEQQETRRSCGEQREGERQKIISYIKLSQRYAKLCLCLCVCLYGG